MLFKMAHHRLRKDVSPPNVHRSKDWRLTVIIFVQYLHTVQPPALLPSNSKIDRLRRNFTKL